MCWSTGPPTPWPNGCAPTPASRSSAETGPGPTPTEPPACSAIAPPPAANPPRTPENRQDRVAVRTRDRHAAIHTLIAQGHGLKQIARELHLGRNTVRRVARAAVPQELLVHAGTGQRARTLEALRLLPA